MIGKVLAGRYEILQRIGGGGMAIVYKGYDQFLNRKVAIKVLHSQFVHDDEFIKRFRREAQAAASLSHPHVVSMYDVGTEGDIYYIVMEYVEGCTLKEKIMESAPLPVEEAINIAVKISDALEHAHQNHIIHRDIKPHNILIGNNGQVKVTDFGIARAVTSASITHTGSVIGSVHYFSPEHAKGVSTGQKSDIYSLGIILYEMLTGVLPFSGESPISVALKHLQEKADDPRNLNPNIPQSVENIILKALMKDPAKRYDSAKEMQADLQTALLPSRKDEPKLIFDEEDDFDKTMVIPAIRRDIQDTMVYEQESTKKKKRWLRPVLWLLISALIFFILFYGVQVVKGLFIVPNATVPSLQGLHKAEAKVKLEQLKLNPVFEERSDESVEKDFVIKQDPLPGMSVKINTPVTLFISTGPKTTKMGNLQGKTLREAKVLLEQLGVKGDQVRVTEEYNDSAPEGTIIQQYPREGDSFVADEVSVELTVSKGQDKFDMPNLIGLSEASAIATLSKYNLVLGENKKEPSYAEPGTVFKQFPYDPGSKVSQGENIDIWVSSGYPAEAKKITQRFNVAALPDGKESEIVILVTDATGTDKEVERMKITTDTAFTVNLVLSPQKNGLIKIFRDGNIEESKAVDYNSSEAGGQG